MLLSPNCSPDLLRAGTNAHRQSAVRPSHHITLNDDELLEIASDDTGYECAVIPGDENSAASRWVLKMHGKVSDASTIVLTRSDDLGFDANRNVFAALVKASLVTKRLVFIGFGLGDDHFH